MNRRRALSLLVATVTVLSLAVGSGSFTAVEADRGVSVEVVNDSEAYVGYNSSDVGPVEKGDEIDLVKLKNRFSEETTLNVKSVDIWTNTSMAIQPLKPYPKLGSGDTGRLEGNVKKCTAGTTTKVNVTVELDGGSVWAKIFGDYYTRTFNVTCEQESTIDRIRFIGAEQIEFQTTNLEDLQGISVTYLTMTKEKGGSGYEIENKGDHILSTNPNKKYKAKNDFGLGQDEIIVAIRIKDEGVIDNVETKTFVRSTFDPSDNSLENPQQDAFGYWTDFDWESYSQYE